MRKLAFILLVVTFFLSLTTTSFFLIKAETKEEIFKKIEEYQKKLTELSQQKNTLSSQIQYMNTQIALMELKIEQTQTKITNTEKEIESLEGKIGALDQSIDYLAKLLLRRLVVIYKNRETSFLQMIFDSDSFPSFINRYKYWKATQEENQRLLIKTQSSKLNLEEQKKLREEKITELEALEKQLGQQKVDLANQKLAKENLLQITSNDEARYQKLLADAQRELNQITQAASFLSLQGEAISVKRGQIIGLQGNTGYSFGDHLHFGVYRYSSINQLVDGWYYTNWIDPSEILSSRTVLWDTGCEPKTQMTIGSGAGQWPLDNPTISQGAGYTCYSQSFYRGNPHPAYDMWGPTGSAVYAVDDGTAYICRNCLGDGGNGVFIFHQNGLMTLYWHLQ